MIVIQYLNYEFIFQLGFANIEDSLFLQLVLNAMPKARLRQEKHLPPPISHLPSPTSHLPSPTVTRKDFIDSVMSFLWVNVGCRSMIRSGIINCDCDLISIVMAICREAPS